MPTTAGPAFSIGGIAQQAKFGPETWGVFLLAVELLLLDRAFSRGSRLSLWLIPVLFLVWANVDESFLIGLAILLLQAIANLIPRGRRKDDETRATSGGLGIVVTVAAAAVCLVNPSLWNIYLAAAGPWIDRWRDLVGTRTVPLTGDQLSFFGQSSSDYFGSSLAGVQQAYYAVVVLIGLATFWLARRRFDLGRFLIYVFVAVLWAGLIRMAGVFAVVWAATLIRNGQDWYHESVGTEGRLGRGWQAFSVGGRAVTILGLFVATALTLTGLGIDLPRWPFIGQPPGLGVQNSEFAFEAADYLKTAEFQGKVVHLSVAQGDALLWRAFPIRQSYIDSRPGIDRRAVREELDTLRESLRKDDPSVWGPILDKYDATAVMLSRRVSLDLRVQQAIDLSRNWVPIYDDGASVIYGRVDKPTQDQAFFEAAKLDAEEMVYRRGASLPVPDRVPARVDWMDRIVRHRNLTPYDPHLDRARRWLAAPPGADDTALLEPARCLLAVREAQIAIAHNPDDPDGYRTLDLALQALTRAEANVLIVDPIGQPTDLLGFRARQRAAALHFAISTLPEPSSRAGGRALGRLHLELARLYRSNGDLDLERDQLRKALDRLTPGSAREFELSEEELRELAQEQTRLDQLVEEVEAFESALAEFAARNQAGPVQKANEALSRGFTGIAIRELENAADYGVSEQAVKPQLVDLYCRTGQPDRANELIGTGPMDSINDPALYTGPGTPAYRHALTSFLLGYHQNANQVWQDFAIPQLRSSIAQEALSSTRGLLLGDARQASESFLQLVGSPGAAGRVQNHATWEIHLGLSMLQSGDPEGAGEHFRKALELEPRNATRPLLAYYLKKLGKEVPPMPEDPAGATTAAAASTAASASGAAGQPSGTAPAETKAEAEAPKTETKKDEPVKAPGDAPKPEGDAKGDAPAKDAEKSGA
jgi:tetratricopeptide (TPR) repeat protein